MHTYLDDICTAPSFPRKKMFIGSKKTIRNCNPGLLLSLPILEPAL